jgi:hypothetical protein
MRNYLAPELARPAVTAPDPAVVQPDGATPGHQPTTNLQDG